MSRRVLVVASTFPASSTDSTPAFVKDQVVAMKQANPTTEYVILAPHDAHSKTHKYTRHESYDEYRFHYFWPFRLEKLTGRGIMPAIKANPANYLLIPFLFIGEFIALLHLTLKIRPDYIYAHWFTPQAVTSHWVSKLTGTPFVFTTHAADVDVWRKIPLFGKTIVRLHSQKAIAITAVSRRSLTKLKAFFSDVQWQTMESKTKIIPMGVSIDTDLIPTDIPGLKAKYDLSDKTVLFFMGRLAEKKGVTYLLEAFAKLQDSSSLQLVIAGDGPLRRTLEKQAARLNLQDQVSFVGYLSGQQKQDYLALSDVMILPSIITDDGDAEGLPVTFMEGLAAGKVCIATYESGADDIIDDKVSGFLIPQKDSSALHDALVEVLQLPLQEIGLIQKNARQAAKQFDWAVIAKKHLDFFSSRLS